MRALRVSALTPDFSGVALQSLTVPSRAKDEVLVEIRAAALNFPDLLMTRGEYQFRPPLPFTSGMEMAGVVVEADSESGFEPGDRVVGGGKTGAFAQYGAFPARSLRPVPQSLDFTQAAAMGTAYVTAYTALVEIGGLAAGQWVLVHGASGGVGLAAVDLAKALGARVIAASGSAEKAARIADLVAPDATMIAQGRFREQVAQITGTALCDLVFDPVGGDVFDESTRCVAFGGKLLVIGFAGGRIASVDTNIPLIKGFSVTGVRAGEYARRFPERGKAVRDAVDALVAQGRIHPQVDRIVPLSQWREGFAAMENRELVGKLVFDPMR
jgi:NADPH2:quinone reductase